MKALTTRCSVLGLLVIVAVWPAVAGAQSPAAPDAELLARIAREPGEVTNYLDLVRLYYYMGRYDDAERAMTHGLAALVQKRAPAAPIAPSAPATPSAASAKTVARPPTAAPPAVAPPTAAPRGVPAQVNAVPSPAPTAPSAPVAGAPVRVGGDSDIPEPRRIKDVPVIYPPAAASAHVTGIVVVEITIDPQGNVAFARVTRSVPALDDAALTAVQQWRYAPTMIKGVAVPVIMTVALTFKEKPAP